MFLSSRDKNDVKVNLISDIVGDYQADLFQGKFWKVRRAIMVEFPNPRITVASLVPRGHAILLHSKSNNASKNLSVK